MLCVHVAWCEVCECVSVSARVIEWSACAWGILICVKMSKYLLFSSKKALLRKTFSRLVSLTYPANTFHLICIKLWLLHQLKSGFVVTFFAFYRLYT